MDSRYDKAYAYSLIECMMINFKPNKLESLYSRTSRLFKDYGYMLPPLEFQNIVDYLIHTCLGDNTKIDTVWMHLIDTYPNMDYIKGRNILYQLNSAYITDMESYNLDINDISVIINSNEPFLVYYESILYRELNLDGGSDQDFNMILRFYEYR